MLKKIILYIIQTINIFFLKKKILFYHVPKSGGTSIRTFLYKYYGTQRISQVKTGNNFADQIKKNPNKKIFFGHAEYKDVIGPENYLQFTILRNPLEMHRSNYFYLKQFSKQLNRTSITSLVEKENLTFESYLLRIKKYYCDNIITRMFSNRSIYIDIFDTRLFEKVKDEKNTKLNDHDYEIALNNLKKIKVYIYEKLDRNIIRQSFNTKIYFPIIMANKTIEKKDLLDSDIYKCREMNNYDFKIYENFKNM